jgi:hypothetical protein
LFKQIDRLLVLVLLIKLIESPTTQVELSQAIRARNPRAIGPESFTDLKLLIFRYMHGEGIEPPTYWV